MGSNILLVNVIVGILLDLFVANIQSIIVKYYILVYLFNFYFFILVAERKKIEIDFIYTGYVSTTKQPWTQ